MPNEKCINSKVCKGCKMPRWVERNLYDTVCRQMQANKLLESLWIQKYALHYLHESVVIVLHFDERASLSFYEMLTESFGIADIIVANQSFQAISKDESVSSPYVEFVCILFMCMYNISLALHSCIHGANSSTVLIVWQCFAICKKTSNIQYWIFPVLQYSTTYHCSPLIAG